MIRTIQQRRVMSGITVREPPAIVVDTGKKERDELGQPDVAANTTC